MNVLSYKESLAKGIEHVDGRDSAYAIQCLIEGKGSRRAALGIACNHASAKALTAWFKNGDLRTFKEWTYISAKLNRMYIQLEPWNWFPAYEHLFALLSDNAAIVNWYKKNKVSYFVEGEIKDRDNPKQAAFHGYQAILALNGEWALLAQRCEQILSMELTKDRKYLVDHRFYLALARGDKAGMETALNELTSPKVARVRNFEQAFGLTENLIATHATIYAKMAWLNGYEVEVDSPWVPKEWLPIQPLENYEDPWDFMKRFDLYEPFEGDWAAWSPRPV